MDVTNANARCNHVFIFVIYQIPKCSDHWTVSAYSWTWTCTPIYNYV